MKLKRARTVTEYSREWRTAGDEYAVRESAIPGYGKRYYALANTMAGWRSIERRGDRLPKTYRTKQAAIDVIAKQL